MKLLVEYEFSHKCFNINFDLIQKVVEAVKTFLADENVRSSKELLEWLALEEGKKSSTYVALNLER